MSSDQGFLEAVLADPDDDFVRLVYADWLEEHGQPERAAFIRVQIELAKVAEDDPRRPGLLHQAYWLEYEHYYQWRDPFAHLHPEAITFHRGFAEEMTLPAEVFLSRADAAFAVTPLRRVRLRGVGDSMVKLCDSPHLERLRGLEISCSELSPSDVARLSGSSRLGSLEHLSLAANRLPASSLVALLRSLPLPSLRSLDLGGNTSDDNVARAIAEGDRPRLRSLALGPSGGEYSDKIRAGGILAIAESPSLAGLEHLDVNWQAIGDAGLAALCGPTSSLALTWLESKQNGIGEVGGAGLEALAASSLDTLRHLDLSCNDVGVGGARALASWPGLGGVRCLYLEECALGDNGVRALARSPFIRRLRELRLGKNRVTDAGARALLESPSLPADLKLDLRHSLIEPPLRAALAERFRIDFD